MAFLFLFLLLLLLLLLLLFLFLLLLLLQSDRNHRVILSLWYCLCCGIMSQAIDVV